MQSTSCVRPSARHDAGRGRGARSAPSRPRRPAAPAWAGRTRRTARACSRTCSPARSARAAPGGRGAGGACTATTSFPTIRPTVRGWRMLERDELEVPEQERPPAQALDRGHALDQRPARRAGRRGCGAARTSCPCAGRRSCARPARPRAAGTGPRWRRCRSPRPACRAGRSRGPTRRSGSCGPRSSPGRRGVAGWCSWPVATITASAVRSPRLVSTVQRRAASSQRHALTCVPVSMISSRPCSATTSCR